MSAAGRALPPDWHKAWKHVKGAISLTTDRADREQSPMFIFVREMQRYDWTPTYRDDPEVVADLIEGMHSVKNEEFRQWMRIPAGERPHLDLFWTCYQGELGGDREDFIALWLTMRWRPGEDPLVTAYDDAIRQPLQIQGPSSRIYRQILSIAYHLQLRQPKRYIMLPQERIAKLLNVSQKIVSDYVRHATSKGLLRVVSSHNFTARQARRYFFNLQRVEHGGLPD